MKNIMTDVMERTYEKLKHFDNHMKKSVTEPYGQKKLTAKEQMDMYRSMTPEKLFNALDTMDSDQFRKFNDWLYKMEQKEQDG